MGNRDRDDCPPTAPKISRRTLLTGAAGITLTGLTTSPAAEAAAAARPAATTGFARFEWLGNAGWRISTPASTLLFDPYLSRFDTGLAAGRFDPATPLSLDAKAVDAALGTDPVTAILVSHTHWDHFTDVPHLGTTRKAMVFTTLTGYHLGRSMGLPDEQIAVVRGGEELAVGDTVIRVVPSLHSRTATGGLLFPDVRTQLPAPPTTIADLPQGDTLGFIIRPPGGRGGVLLLGASDFDDQALRGLEVDAVALPVPANDVTVDYVGRLLRALDKPRTVVLVHWDDFESPLANPPKTSDKTRARMDAVTAEITRVSPRTRVIAPEYLTPLSLL